MLEEEGTTKTPDGNLHHGISGLGLQDTHKAHDEVFLPPEGRHYNFVPFAHRHGLSEGGVGGGVGEDGDATPRRRPSPPPSNAIVEEESYDDEDEEDDGQDGQKGNGEEDEEVSNGGRDFDGTHSELGTARSQFLESQSDAAVRHQQRDAAVLGFDGRAYGPRRR